MTSSARPSFDPIAFQVLWSRMISIADEMAAALVRTAFSRAVSDGHDYACAIYAADGSMVAQSTHCTPGLIGSMPQLVTEITKAHLSSPISDGDVFICNDPWIGAGHTPDVYIVTPVFHEGDLVAFCANAAHHIDVGGRGYSPISASVYEEGLLIPPSKLYVAGKPNRDLIRIIERNVRLPDKVLGDLRAQMAANHVGASRVRELFKAERLASLTALAAQIATHTESAMAASISTVPEGTYQHEVVLEEPDAAATPLRVRATVSVSPGSISIDFEGTSPQVPRPLNCVYNFTYAYAVFAIKSALHPDIPNNAGAVRPIRVSAPPRSLLNAEYPAPVMLRTSMVYYAVEAIFTALAPVIPDKVLAPSGTYPLWRIVFSGSRGDGARYVYIFWANGGQGAAGNRDGRSAVVFPPNTSNTSAEIFEEDTGLTCLSKEFIPDSAGVGQFRGGFGQRILVRNDGHSPVQVSAFGGRYLEGANGLVGGGPGRPGSIRVDGGSPLRSVDIVSLRPGEIIDLEFPGGGGWGDPLRRDPYSVKVDVQCGLVSASSARSEYAVVIDDTGVLDEAATRSLRSQRVGGANVA